MVSKSRFIDSDFKRTLFEQESPRLNVGDNVRHDNKVYKVTNVMVNLSEGPASYGSPLVIYEASEVSHNIYD